MKKILILFILLTIVGCTKKEIPNDLFSRNVMNGKEYIQIILDNDLKIGEVPAEIKIKGWHNR